ncbi:transposase [Candidatus Gracilibacteria bacterium]|nr:transposase [Candidatus Gracilibacteria bacterium]
MKYDADIHKRKSIRLQDYDYTKSGFYFVTICVHGKINLFGCIENRECILNDAGQMIEKYWKELENKYSNIKLHDYVIMPNHIHGIIEIVGADLCVGPDSMDIGPDDSMHFVSGTSMSVGPHSMHIESDHINMHKGSTHRLTPTGGEYIFDRQGIPEIIKWFKVMTTNAYIKQVRKGISQPFEKKLWQRNYYEHIIRSEHGFQKISGYIKDNPAKWELDELYTP